MSVSQAPWQNRYNLGSQRELFVDHFLIAKMDGAELKLHEPRREGVALKFDRPWEGGWSCYTTVIKDGGTYRMYYRGMPTATGDDSPEAVVCYAESKDGITWTKPNLGLFDIRGTLENNVILTNAPYAHNFSPLLDERPGVPKAEKFKALAGDHKTGLARLQVSRRRCIGTRCNPKQSSRKGSSIRRTWPSGPPLSSNTSAISAC